jgi:cytochrome c oxidase assembly factor CtaG
MASVPPVDPYRWSWDADALVVIPGMAAAYAIALTRFPAPRWRIVCFGVGCGLMLAVQITPLDTLALHYLLVMHLLQNVVLAEWGPLLIVIGLTPRMARELERIPGAPTLTHPLVALPIWLGVYYTWHVPWAYDAALRHQWTILHLEHATYFFAAFALGSPLGLLLALLPHAVYGFYLDVPRLWGLSPLVDQQIAGVTMASEQSIVLFAVFAFYLLRFFDEESSADTYRAPTVRRGSPRSP